MKIRIITGYLKHRNLYAPEGKHKVRSTTAFVKKAIMDILQQVVAESSVLDLFAGTGNVGIEFISNRAGRAVFVEANPHNCRIIQRNLSDLGVPEERYRIVRGNVTTALSSLHEKFDFIFLDPPYRENLVESTLALIGKTDICRKGALIIAEHAWKERTGERTGPFVRTDSRRYGSTVLDFFRAEGRPGAGVTSGKDGA